MSLCTTAPYKPAAVAFAHPWVTASPQAVAVTPAQPEQPSMGLPQGQGHSPQAGVSQPGPDQLCQHHSPCMEDRVPSRASPAPRNHPQRRRKPAQGSSTGCLAPASSGGGTCRPPQLCPMWCHGPPTPPMAPSPATGTTALETDYSPEGKQQQPTLPPTVGFSSATAGHSPSVPDPTRLCRGCSTTNVPPLWCEP